MGKSCPSSFSSLIVSSILFAQLNIEAARLLKHLEAKSREATPEQKHILARYTIWGIMLAAFDRSDISMGTCMSPAK